MFTNFFYTCKAKGLSITLSEWLTLQEALDKGLGGSSLTQFYYLARMILVKSETDFDKFDMAFEETFKGIQSENEISKNMMKWLDKSELIDMVDEEERYRMNEQDGIQFIDKDEVEAKFKERLRDQDSEHNGGSFWIGSMGKTAFGNMGGFMGGIRVEVLRNILHPQRVLNHLFHSVEEVVVSQQGGGDLQAVEFPTNQVR